MCAKRRYMEFGEDSSTPVKLRQKKKIEKFLLLCR